MLSTLAMILYPMIAAAAGLNAQQAGMFLGGTIAAIAAIGMKTQLKELQSVGWKPVARMVGETLFLAMLVLAWLRWGGALG